MGISLVLLSGLIYLIQILVFHRQEDTAFYLFQDIAFLPIYVLLVTIIVDRIFARREKQAMLSKMNMVIGAFFSEVGTELLRTLSGYDRNNDAFVAVLLGNKDWSDRKFEGIRKYLETHDFKIDTRDKDMESLKSYLVRRRVFMLRLLENPNLLEHDTFTDLLWAVMHLTEELAYRYDVTQLTDPDRKHIEGDITRAYSLLILEWLAYIRHLRDSYPYIFHLVARINPFDKEAAAEVR